MDALDILVNGCPEDPLDFLIKPEIDPNFASPSKSRSYSVSGQTSNPKITSTSAVPKSITTELSGNEFRTSIADQLISIYSPLFIGKKNFLYREELGCYTIADDSEFDFLVEDLIASPVNNSQPFTISVRKEVERRCYTGSFKFNPSPNFVNFSDCVCDLKTKQKFPHYPEFCFNYHLNCTPFKTTEDDFVNSATARFLYQICEGDKTKIRLLQEQCGVLLTGLHCKGAIFWIGVHDSGKSTLAKLLQRAIGEHQTSAVPFSQFDEKFSKVKLCSSRLNVGGEFNQKSTEAQWNFFKEITGGDTVCVEEKFCSPFQTVIESKLLFLGNFLPHNMPDDDALYDRIKIFEFSYCVPKAKRDPELQQKLYAEKDIFAWWAYHGALRYLHNGCQFTELDDQPDLRMIGNPVTRFLSRHLEPASEEEFVLKLELYHNFIAECKNNGIHNPPSKTAFYEALHTLFGGISIKQKTINGKREYVIYGIRYKE